MTDSDYSVHYKIHINDYGMDPRIVKYVILFGNPIAPSFVDLQEQPLIVRLRGGYQAYFFGNINFEIEVAQQGLIHVPTFW